MRNISFIQQLMYAVKHEFRCIATNRAVLLVLMGGIFMYGLLYNYMYAPNLVTQIPVAVVDRSHSAMSRKLLRWLNATPQIKVQCEVMDEPEAKRFMQEGKVKGILYLPHDLETRVLRGEKSVFAVYATTDAFLVFEALQEATSRVMMAVNEAYRPCIQVFLPSMSKQAVAMTHPIQVSGTALYNYTKGYGSYLIPSVLMIILFQTLLMIIGMLSGEENCSGGLRCYRNRGEGWAIPLSVVLGKMLVYVSLYAVFSLFLLGFLPYLFSIPNIGDGYSIIQLMLPYLMSTSFLGLAASRYFTDSETPLLMIAFFSVGLIFLSGVSYPLELMPWYWKILHAILPAPPAVPAFVQMNSMGATLWDVQYSYFILWIQTFVYFLLSLWVYRQKIFPKKCR